MKIQRFVARDSKQAMRLVREAMGGDAVILSSSRVEEGIEVVAAADYDDKLLNPARAGHGPATSNQAPRPQPTGYQKPSYQHPASYQPASYEQPPAYQRPVAQPSQQRPVQQPAQAKPDLDSYNEMRRELTNLRGMLEGELSQLSQRDMGQRQPLRNNLVRRLGGLGLSRDLSLKLTEQLPGNIDMDHGWDLCLRNLGSQIIENQDDIINNGGRVAVVGPTGVGKTTSVAKLAARFAMRHGRKQVALITTDCYRIGGQEQIYTFGRILGVPVRVATNREELSQALSEFADRKLVMIDTAGMSQRDMGLTQQFETLTGVEPGIKIYLTLSATSQLAILDEVVRKFSSTNLAGAIVTKVDETASMGPILSALIRYKLSVAYIGNGQRVPEDLHLARATGLVKHAEEMMETVGWNQPVMAGDSFGGMTLNAGLA